MDKADETTKSAYKAAFLVVAFAIGLHSDANCLIEQLYYCYDHRCQWQTRWHGRQGHQFGEVG